jgi:hypothetical protein
LTVRPAWLAVLAIVAVAGCARSGFDAAVEKDVQDRMETARPPITACYAEALKIDRKLRGMIVVRFEATRRTGQFSNVTVLRDDLGDGVLLRCVVEAVSRLRLASPTADQLAVTYPLEFAPVK